MRPVEAQALTWSALSCADGGRGTRLIRPCGAQTFCGWLYGQFPPALFGNFRLAGANLLNMFRAHEAAYQAIKALPGDQQGLDTP